jgi:uncharacterized protein YoxC
MYKTLSDAAATLFTLYLKTKGVDPADHSFQKEQGRLKQYHKKVRKLAAEVEIKKSNRTLEVDVAAMSRFIAAAVPDLNAQQKEDLKNVGNKGKKREGKISKQEAAGGLSKRLKKSNGGGDGSSRAVSHKDAALQFLHDALDEVKPSK